jgi:hypothetical protein
MPKNSPLVRLSVPERLGIVFEKVSFDVPRTIEGGRFMNWWDSATRNQRDQVMKTAHAENITVVEALEKLTESE